MAKPPRLAHVKYVHSKGRIYAYFNTGRKAAGKAVYERLPDPGTPGFWDSYAAFNAARNRRAAPVDTVASLIADYERSAEYRDKAPATQRLYSVQFRRLETTTLARFPVEALEACHITDVLDGEGWNAGTRNAFVAAIGALYAWARKRGKTERKPTAIIEKAKGGEHDPWPEPTLEAALSCDDDLVRLAVHLLYFTGQRIGDVCRLRWTDIASGWITLRQQKTKHVMQVPVAGDLQAELDATPRRGLTIITRPDGRPYHPATLRAKLQAFTLAHGHKTVAHGLRKNAVNALLEAGCTHYEVQAITGQSLGMIEHYAAKVNRRHLGSAAILKLEQGRNRKTVGKPLKNIAEKQRTKARKR